MAIKISCACGKTLSVKDELAGRRVKCPACQQTFSVPKPEVRDDMFDDERDEQDPADDLFLFDDEPAESSAKSPGATKPRANWTVSWDEETPDDVPQGGNLGLIIGLSIGGAGLAMALLAWMLLPNRPTDNVAGKPNDITTSGPAQSTAMVAVSQDELQQSRDKLKAISQALGKNLPNDFTKSAYPAGYSDQEGKLILSWRVAILPALGEEVLWKQFRLDEPWDSEHNRQLIPKMPAVFKAVRGESKEGHTYYRGFAGAEAMFPLKSPKVERVQHGDRWCYPVSCRTFGKTTDGTSNTFLIAEGAESVPWTKPEELICDSKQPLPKLGGQFDGDFFVLLADGAAMNFSRTVPEDARRTAINPTDGVPLRFKAGDASGFVIEVVTPAMADRMYTLSRLAAASPHGAAVQIKDDTNETAFAGMVSTERSVPWTKPDDLILDDTFQSNEPPKDLSKVNAFTAGAIMFANGSIRHVHLQEGMDPKMFRALFTIAGGEPSPISKLYPPNFKTIQPTYATLQEHVRHAEARTANKNSLKAIALAFQNYEQTFRHYPPATVYGPDGKPWHSWRVVILPFLGHNDLYEKYDASVPWDHPNNAAVLSQMPPVYRDPLSGKPNSNKTPYLVVTGPSTAFPTRPIGNVVAPMPAQPTTAQPAPPKPVAKDGREPIEYQPFRPDVWKAKNQSTWLFPWEGERIVLLTTTADLDPKTMAVFVKQLDAGWKLCSDLVGQSPRPFRVHKGKATIAAVPDNSFSDGGLVAYLGMTGIEVGGFYVPRGDYDQVRQNPEKFPDGFFFGIGQNHFVFGNQCGVLSTGGIVALRHICAEAINGSDKDPQADQTIYRYEEAFAKSNATFQDAFAPFGATKPFVLNDLDGKPFGNIELNVFIASTFLKLRKDNGGDEWTKRFFRHLGTCPTAAERDIDGAKAQLLNWVVASSLAAEKDLTSMLRDRWRFPLAPEVWQSLKTVDWKKPGLTADQVFDAIPVEHLLPTVAMNRPGFLTPERRKQNLIVGGTFEDGSGGTWTVGSFRRNAAAAVVEGGVVKEGQKAVVIRAPIDDDARYLQTVAVKPNRRYLVSGWIKTKDVVVAGNQTGRTGANLSIDAHTYEMSQSVVGTNDWRYASFIFDSGTRTEVLVCARIGFVYSVAKGEAWFDDLCLIAIGESPARPTATPQPSNRTPPPALAANPPAVILNGHTQAVARVSFSADGKRLASASIDQSVKVWDANSGQVTHTLEGHTAGVTSVAFSPDGKLLASASHDKTVKLWDATSGKETLTLKGHTGSVTSVAFSPDGKRLASVSYDSALKMWNTTSGQEIPSLKGRMDGVYSVAFSPDGKRLASANSNKTVKIWDANTGKESITLSGHTGNVMNVTFSPDGKWLASASMDQTVKVWDAASGQETHTLKGHTGYVTSVAFSPDGKRLASSGPNGEVKLWDTRSGQETLSLKAHNGNVFNVMFSPDGKRLASSGQDQTAKVWDITPRLEDDKARTKTTQEWKGWPKDAPPPAIAPFNAEQAKQLQEAWAKHLGVPVEYTNSIGMKFVLVPPGEFTMGSTPAEMDEARKHISADDKPRGEGSIKSEGPQHKVILTQPYYLGAHEVRQQDYEAAMGVNPAIFSQNGPQPAFRPNFDTAKMPVENVNWINAADFCARLSVKEKLKPTYLRTGLAITPLVGNGYRLPTEAEWEFACRAGTSTRVWFARDEDVSQFVWLANPAGGRPYPVRQLKPNPFGLYDIYGNVCEWVQDGWSPTAYEPFSTEPAIDPATPFGSTSERVLRGLVWPFTATGIRSSSRRAEPMTNARHFFGFRAALSVDAVKGALAKPAQAVMTVDATGKRTVRVTQATQDDPLTASLRGHEHAVSSVAVSPDGKSLASGDLYGSTLVWNVADRNLRFELPGTAGANIVGLAISPDGKLIATGNGKSVKLWDAPNGRELKTLSGHTDLIWSVAFSPPRYP